LPLHNINVIVKMKLGGTCTCKECGAQVTTNSYDSCVQWMNSHRDSRHNKAINYNNMKNSELRETIRKEIRNIFEQQSGSMCSNGVSQQALQVYMPNASNPQLGNHGITQNFVNNMANKSSQFYNSRAVAFANKAIQLNGGSGQMFCNGKNPMWQASLMLRKIYAEQCKDNPGTCV